MTTADQRQAECYCGARIASVGGGSWFRSGSWPAEFRCYPDADNEADRAAKHEPVEGTVRQT